MKSSQSHQKVKTFTTYYNLLLDQIPNKPSSPLGNKDKDLALRIEEAKRLTSLMELSSHSCFLRLGDMDLVYLLAQQEGLLEDVPYDEGAITGTRPLGNPGIGPRYAIRLRKAFQEANYVDFHQRLWPMEYLLPKLDLQRSPLLHQNPTRTTSYLLLTWLEKEFKMFCQGKRIGFVGAEARLLEILSKTAEFHCAARDYWPDRADIFFHQVRENGRNLNTNLDMIKEDIRQFIRTHRLDALFLSLGGGAKILCYELSQEESTCCFDFGAAMRALTYSACDGNRAARSTHSPFLFRLSFSGYMNALEKAFQELTPEELLAKAHAQLLLEVQKKEVGWTHSSFEYDFSTENLAAFRNSYEEYQKRYNRIFRYSAITIKERRDFLYFSGIHDLTKEGQFFYWWIQMKVITKHILNRLLKARVS